MSRFKKWAEYKYSKQQRIIALLLEGTVFVIAFPFLLVAASSYFDIWFHFPIFFYGLINRIVALPFLVIGLVFAMWAVKVQFSVGRGTPAPIMPTQKLIVQRPYSYCRNPMTFGTIVFYLGVSVWIGSLSAVGLTLLFVALLIIYVKLIEERELEERFGLEYLDYKRRTPFLIPRLWKRN